MENKTGCECPLASFCNRHGVTKSPHQHKLCQTHPGYFQKWEDCKGPGQRFTDCKKQGEVPVVGVAPPEQPKGPLEVPPVGATEVEVSLWQQAKNLAAASIAHAQSGFGHVSPEEKQRRLSICDGCPFLIRDQNRCSKCGCQVQAKSSWASSHCPELKW